MFGAMKEKAIEKAVATLEAELAPLIQEKIELFKNLQPADINDDQKYEAIVVSPLWEFAKMQSGGAISVAQKLVDVQARFNQGLFNVRDELVEVQGQTVTLSPDFSEKLVPTLMKSLKG